VIRPGEAQAAEAEPIVLPIHGLPDLRVARQPSTGDDAARIAIAYADAHSPSQHRWEATAHAGYRALNAYDAAAMIGGRPAGHPSYGLGLADLYARMRDEPSAIDRALATH